MNVLTWDTIRHGSLDLPHVRAMHQPARGFRISQSKIEFQKELDGASIAGKFLVLSGRCSLQYGDECAELQDGEYVEHPGGNYSLRITRGPLVFITALALPTAAWQSFEGRPRDAGAERRVFVSSVVDDAEIVRAVARRLAISEHGVAVIPCDRPPRPGVERMVDRSIAPSEWPLRLILPLIAADVANPVDIAMELSVAEGVRCLIEPDVPDPRAEWTLIEQGARCLVAFDRSWRDSSR